MPAIDLKKATIYICDGRNTAITASGLTYTLAHKNWGTRHRPIITLVDPEANSSALAITVDEYTKDIEVSLATDGSGNITTTAAQLQAALAADADAAAIVTVTGTGAVPLAEGTAADFNTVDGPRNIEVKIGEGNLTYSEKKAREYIKDRGRLDIVRDGDEDPVEVRMDYTWEFLSSSEGATTPTIEEVFKQTGPAATWVSTDTDACQPYALDLEIVYDPGCGGGNTEYIMLPLFRWESLDHDLSGATVAVAGNCNVTSISPVRLS